MPNPYVWVWGTYDAQLKSWLDSANNATTNFPIQDLTFGESPLPVNAQPYGGMAIGDLIIGLYRLSKNDLLDVDCNVFNVDKISGFMAQGSGVWSSTRARLFGLFKQSRHQPSKASAVSLGATKFSPAIAAH
jgi:fumarylacetoacetase